MASDDLVKAIRQLNSSVHYLTTQQETDRLLDRNAISASEDLRWQQAASLDQLQSDLTSALKDLQGQLEWESRTPSRSIGEGSVAANSNQGQGTQGTST